MFCISSPNQLSHTSPITTPPSLLSVLQCPASHLSSCFPTWVYSYSLLSISLRSPPTISLPHFDIAACLPNLRLPLPFLLSLGVRLSSAEQITPGCSCGQASGQLSLPFTCCCMSHSPAATWKNTFKHITAYAHSTSQNNPWECPGRYHLQSEREGQLHCIVRTKHCSQD